MRVGDTVVQLRSPITAIQNLRYQVSVVPSSAFEASRAVVKKSMSASQFRKNCVSPLMTCRTWPRHSLCSWPRCSVQTRTMNSCDCRFCWSSCMGKHAPLCDYGGWPRVPDNIIKKSESVQTPQSWQLYVASADLYSIPSPAIVSQCGMYTP